MSELRKRVEVLLERKIHFERSWNSERILEGVSELAINLKDYIKDGGIVKIIKVKEKDKLILKIIVEDEGKGMSEEDIERAFAKRHGLAHIRMILVGFEKGEMILESRGRKYCYFPSSKREVVFEKKISNSDIRRGFKVTLKYPAKARGTKLISHRLSAQSGTRCPIASKAGTRLPQHQVLREKDNS